MIEFRRRPMLDYQQLQELFVAGWGSSKVDFRPVLEHSFTWIAAFSDEELIGFVNVAWDGGVHYFLLDTTVHPDWRLQGIGKQLVLKAIDECRGKGHWMHVDSDEELMNGFYAKCGFRRANAGLVDLRL